MLHIAVWFLSLLCSYKQHCSAMQESVSAALAALQPAVETPGPLQFGLNFLWLEKNVAIAVDQLFEQVLSHCADTHVVVSA